MFSSVTELQLYAGGLVFARIGALVMLIPGLGDATVPPRMRLAFALLMAMVLTPVVGAGVSGLPASLADMAGAIIREVLVGLMIGTILRLFFNVLSTAGEVISIQTTLAFAQTTNPTQAQPTTAVTGFLMLMGVVLIMVTDLHHMFLSAMARSFTLFPFGHGLPIKDSASLAIQTVGGSFALGLQMAAPVMVFSVIFNIASGLVGRAMPQFQIFVVATPLSLLLGLSLFALSLGVIVMVWVSQYRVLVGQFK